ncbi:MAG TPA: hypothetical protein VGM90_14920 [Kofleriaceae bacterium]|jgi:hypothetical protein
MAIITDNHSRRVLISNGEGLDERDPNDMQTFAASQLVENLLMSAGSRALDNPISPLTIFDGEIGDVWNAGTTPQSTDVFCPYAGAGYVRATSNARELTTVAGPVMQCIGDTFDGSGESVAMFRLGTSTLTTAIGDATNPRVDLVEIKLEFVDADQESRDFEDAITGAKTTITPYKTRRVVCSIQINQGTPAANPSYPTPTAGFAALAAVYVPASHNAVHSPDNLRDQRFPLGSVRVYDTPASDFYRPGGTPWTLNQEQYVVDAGSTAASVYAYCPAVGKNARLVGVSVYGRWGDGLATNVELVRTLHQIPGTPAHTVLAAPSTSLCNGTAALRSISAITISDQLNSGAVHKGLRVANRRVGVPMWMNGWPAGVTKPETASEPTTVTKLGLKITSQSTTDPALVSFVRWFVLTGL